MLKHVFRSCLRAHLCSQWAVVSRLARCRAPEKNFDVALMKETALKESRRVQFRVEAFNVFNHTNFANPVHDESNANFGKITQTVGTALATSVGTTAGAVGGPRQVQLALRLSF